MAARNKDRSETSYTIIPSLFYDYVNPINGGMGKHYIGPVDQRTGSLSASFLKIACLVGPLRSGPYLVGRLGSGVWVSASFQKMPASWVGGRLG